MFRKEVRKLFKTSFLKVGDAVADKKEIVSGRFATPMYILERKGQQVRTREGWHLATDLQHVIWLCDSCLLRNNIVVHKYAVGQCAFCNEKKDFPGGAWISKGDIDLNPELGEDDIGISWGVINSGPNSADIDAVCPTCGDDHILRNLRHKPNDPITYRCNRCGALKVPDVRYLRISDCYRFNRAITTTKELKQWIDHNRKFAGVGDIILIDGQEYRLIVVGSCIRLLDLHEHMVRGQGFDITSWGDCIDTHMKLSIPILYTMYAPEWGDPKISK